MTINNEFWWDEAPHKEDERLSRHERRVDEYAKTTVSSIHHIHNERNAVDDDAANLYRCYAKAADRGEHDRAARCLDELKYKLYEGRTDLESDERSRRLARISGFNLMTANDTIERSSLLPNPRALYLSLWYEGEISVLYADTNIGKSIFAVQIADSISRNGKRVLYVDLELSDKGFEMRCKNPKTGRHYKFSPNFFRMTLDKMTFRELNGDDGIGVKMLDNIVNVALELEADCIIIDNLTALAESPNSASTALDIVTRLVQVKENTGMSVLLVAHTPKMKKNEPITRDAIAGSKLLINLVDSAFAIGASLSNPKIRYIKQTKVRMGRFEYGEDNVIVSEIQNVKGLLKFVRTGENTENEMLLTLSEVKRRETYRKIGELFAEDYGAEDIAKIMGMSETAVKKIINEIGLK